MHELNQESAYRLASDILHVDTPGEVVLMDYASGKYFGLKGAVRRIFDRLRDGASLTEMTAEIASHYQVSEEMVRNDLLKVLDALEKAGLVSRTG